jgi:hypothetical protein
MPASIDNATVYFVFTVYLPDLHFCVRARPGFMFVKMPADGTGLPIIIRIYAANSAHRRFIGSLQESKAPDRAGKLHGYRINAYVRLGVKHTRLTVCWFRPLALAVQTPDVPQKAA